MSICLKFNLTKYKQFFTPNSYSSLLIQQITTKNPKTILDLTMGSGNLLFQAKTRWPKSKIYGNDIDKECLINNEVLEHTNFEVFNLDMLTTSCITTLKKRIGEVDVCLGNPPFGLTKLTEEVKEIFRNAEYSIDKSSSEYIETELVFILQCLEILKDGGELISILPDGFFVNNKMKNFRKYLIQKYYIRKVIELPESIFEKTCAKTHIMVLVKKNIKNRNITLQLDSQLERIAITQEEAIFRMDYSYHIAKQSSKAVNYLEEEDAIFARGRPCYQLKSIHRSKIIHTTNFTKQLNIFESNYNLSELQATYNGAIATEGDIVIPRVGKTKIGQVGLIKKGAFIISDCVFVIKPSSKIIYNKILQTLLSEDGKSWLFSICKGVAAKHITLADFKNFPLMNTFYDYDKHKHCIKDITYRNNTQKVYINA